VAYYRYIRSKLINVSLIAVFGLVLFSAVPTFLDSVTTNIRLAIAQPEDQFSVTGNETLTPAQSAAREQLLQQEGLRSTESKATSIRMVTAMLKV
jgi:hypothetical protein